MNSGNITYTLAYSIKDMFTYTPEENRAFEQELLGYAKRDAIHPKKGRLAVRFHTIFAWLIDNTPPTPERAVIFNDLRWMFRILTTYDPTLTEKWDWDYEDWFLNVAVFIAVNAKESQQRADIVKMLRELPSVGLTYNPDDVLLDPDDIDDESDRP